MNRTQTACFALIGSAFVLAAILIVQVDRKSQSNTAQADGQVIAQPAFTMMTARTRGGAGQGGDESLFVLDNNSGVLIVYNPNIGRKQLQPVTAIRMTDVFGGGGGGGR